MAAHLLDSACRRLSFERDGASPPPPEGPLDGYRDLVRFLDRLNAEWITAAERLSPQLLVDLLAVVEGWLAAHLEDLDPWAPAIFPVTWAGEEESQTWFDVARELTERWHHQAQIRLAVDAPPLFARHLFEPVLETFLRALPHRYREVEKEPGSGWVLEVEVADAAAPYRLAYTLLAADEASTTAGEAPPQAPWRLLRGAVTQPTARVSQDAETAWRLLTKGFDLATARHRSQIEGEEALVEPYLRTLAVMA